MSQPRLPHDPRWAADETIRIPHRRFESADAGQAAPEPLREGTDVSKRPAQRYPRTALTGTANGMPPDRPYKYRRPRAAWALQALADAQAQHPEEGQPKRGRPVKGAVKPAARPARAKIDPARVMAAMEGVCPHCLYVMSECKGDHQ